MNTVRWSANGKHLVTSSNNTNVRVIEFSTSNIIITQGKDSGNNLK